MTTNKWALCAGRVLAVALLGAPISCTSDKKDDAASQGAKQGAIGGGTASLSYKPGEAGGMAEETVTGSATVKAIDPATRKITLSTEDGRQAVFTAPAEVHNFDRIHAGDKVNVTLHERLVVYVDRNEREPSATHAAALARAPKGAKPGAIAGESFELVATITEIDTAGRRATLRFPNGQTRVIPVREDVDLSKYKAGNSVVIQVTQQLTLLVNKP